MQKSNSENMNNEAREWFTLMQSGSVTELQQQHFEHWLNENSEHQQAYRQYEMIWEDLGVLAKSSEADALRRSVASGKLEEFLKNIGEYFQQPWGEFNSRVKIQLSAFACASIILVAVIVGNSMGSENVVVNQYATTTAEIKQITLADGSQITLGAKTHIETWTTTNERHVTLIDGQAFFKVAKNPKRPFFVNAENTLIKVVGTQFDVRKGSDRTRVAVLEGIVNVTNTTPESNNSQQSYSTPIVLTAGQQVTHLNTGKFELVKEVSTVELEAWRNGRLIYRNASLADVVADANRYFNGHISLSSTVLADLKVTAAISTNQIESMTDMLSKSLPVSINKEANNRILISPKEDTTKVQQHEK